MFFGSSNVFWTILAVFCGMIRFVFFFFLILKEQLSILVFRKNKRKKSEKNVFDSVFAKVLVQLSRSGESEQFQQLWHSRFDPFSRLHLDSSFVFFFFFLFAECNTNGKTKQKRIKSAEKV